MTADIFRSERLIYRGVEDNGEDANFFCSLSLDSESRINNDHALLQPTNKALGREKVRRWREDSLMGVIICLPISPDTDEPTHHDDGTAVLKPIGSMRVHKIPEHLRHHRTTRFGIYIARQYQRQGYGSEAIAWVLSWAFQWAGLHRLGLYCFSHNEGAIRLYERLGFVHEGKERESVWYAGGWHDEILMGMLASEWLAGVEEREREREARDRERGSEIGPVEKSWQEETEERPVARLQRQDSLR